ncbi:MAG: OmpA family protein, partial [Bacteroidota bacterium]
DRLTTNYLSLNYSNPGRTTGLSVSLLADQSTNLNFFTTNEWAIHFAKAINLNFRSKLAMGVGYNRSRTRLDLTGLTTSAQFVPGRGFNNALENGEAHSVFEQRNNRLHTGLYYQQYDEDEFSIMEVGFALNDIDLRALSSDQVSRPSSLIFNAMRKTKLGRNGYVGGEFYYHYINADHSLIVGATFDHVVDWSQKNRFWHDVFRFIVRYHTIGYASVAMRIKKEALTLGMSYDFYRGTNPINNGMEVAIGYELPSAALKFSKKRKKRRKTPPIYHRRKSGPPKAPIRGKPANTETPVSDDDVPGDEETEDPLEEEDEPVKVEDLGSEVEESEFDIELNRLYVLSFDFASHDLTTYSRIYLERVLEELKDFPDYGIVVYGHTDSIGTDAHNQKLSVRRGNTIRRYLVDEGIDGNRIQVIGMGESAPIASNEHARGRSENRRVEIKLLKDYSKSGSE